MYSYQAYGLGIRSPFPIAELAAGDGPADVEVRLTPGELLEEGAPNFTCVAAPEAIELYFAGAGRFRVRNGRLIELTLASAAERRLIEIYLAGNAMACVLYQRGLFVLHASVIAIEGSAYACVGASGEGKSSMGAALYARGHTLVSDDIAAITLATTGVLVAPAYPQFKLAPETGVCLGYPIEKLQQIHPRLEELVFRTNNFASEPLPLAGIFVLDEGPDLLIERQNSREAALTLLAHSYGIEALYPAIDYARHLNQCAQIARTTPVYRLYRPRVLSRLPEVARFVEQFALEHANTVMIRS